MFARRIAVCHVASGDLWAGAEVQIATLLRMLARRQDFELSAMVLNPGRLADEILGCGIDVSIIPESQRNFVSILSGAERFLKPKGIQILHSHRYKENLLASLVARRCEIPTVVRTQHGLSEPLDGFKGMKQQFIQTLDRFVARRATDRVICVSSEMRGHLAQKFDTRKLVVIPNGVDLAIVRSEMSVAEAKERLGIPRDFHVLGTAGRIEPIKRLDIFLDAAKIISGELPDARFIIVGTGRAEAALRDKVRHLQLGERVKFLGHREDIYDVLRAMDVLVLCSDHEGLPMILLEALALGVVVVARAVGGIPEVIVHNTAGVLVHDSDPKSLAQACRNVLSDKMSAARLAQAGMKLVAEKFSAEATAAATASLYNQLAAAPAATRAAAKPGVA
ncbi:MAG TPA: glycosyltransferase family 4 protein [Terriglobia bacterium]|nr:glycosyltransferase family 4 protein [Terriglobia bacterium]